MAQQASGPSAGRGNSSPNGNINRVNNTSTSNSTGNQHVNSTINDVHRDRALSGLARADANKRGNSGSSLPRNSSSSPSGLNSNSNINNVEQTNSTQSRTSSPINTGRRISNNIKKQFAQEAIKDYAAAHGVPRDVTDKLLKTKKGQELLDKTLNKKMDPMSSLSGLPSKPNKKLDKKDSEKTIDEKSDEQEAEDIGNGRVTFEFSLKTIKLMLILTPVFAIISFALLIITTSLTDEKTSSMILAGMSSEKEKESLKQEIGQGGSAGYGGADDKYPKEYYQRLARLGNVYSSQLECTGEKCLSRPEFMYYLKIADLSSRYKDKYNVNLDWYLISATDLYFTKTSEQTMNANLGGYDENTLDNTNVLNGLDWDNDFKNIPGYVYLDADNSTYDLQILAKNMVKKKTTQSCIDSNGNTVSTQEDEDVEDKYFEVGGDKRLNCGAGETYNIFSSYKKDMDKFDEFMLEYIDKKMYTKGSGSKGNTTCLTSGSDNSNFIWAVGSAETTNSNGVEFALGTPVSVQITSYFGSSESFRNGSGHGAIDISNPNGIGKVPVIASKAGTVVYPTSKAQTSYADNGYIGNNDGWGYGNHVIIDHGDGIYTLYAHMAKDSITVMSGDTVAQGQVIGKIGNSGNSTGTHLHFEMRKGSNDSSHRVDPLNYVDPKNPRNGASSTPGSCSSGSSSLATAFVNLAVSQKNDPSASGGQKYRNFLCPSCNYYAWCAAFVSWNIYNTEYNGQKLSDIINFKSTWVYEFMNDFYNAGKNNPNSAKKFYYNDNCSKLSGKNGSGTYTPKPGDLIFFDWNGAFQGMPTDSSHVSHIGIVQKVENGVITTIEGNSGGGNGYVKENTFNLNSCDVVGFGSWY